MYTIRIEYNTAESGEDAEEASSCRSLSSKEPLIVGLFCGKRPTQMRHFMGLRHPVALHEKYCRRVCESTASCNTCVHVSSELTCAEERKMIFANAVVCVCMCVCVCVCMYVCVCVCMCGCVHLLLQRFQTLSICMFEYLYIYKSTDLYFAINLYAICVRT